MGRLIDESDVVDALVKRTGLDWEYLRIMEPICKVIENVPAVDAVPIIRCKDCKYSEHWYRDKRRCFLWHETGIDVFEDGYCNYAERKDNG